MPEVTYPAKTLFGAAGQPTEELAAVLDRLEKYVKTLMPDAEVHRQLMQ